MRLTSRLLDWLCTRLGLCLDFDGDLMTPDWRDGDGDPVYRPAPAAIITTPQEHAARLKERRYAASSD